MDDICAESINGAGAEVEAPRPDEVEHPPDEADRGAGGNREDAAIMAVFQNRIRSTNCPQELKEKWATEIKKMRQTDPARRQFMLELGNTSSGDLKTVLDTNTFFATFKKKKLVENEDEGGNQGGWFSYHYCCTRDGKTVVDDAIKRKSVETRHSLKLAPDSEVPWPQNLELEWSDDVFKNTTRTRTTSEKIEADADAECDPAFEQQFETTRARLGKNAVRNTEGPKCTPHVAVPSQAKAGEGGRTLESEHAERKHKEKVLASAASLQKSHAEWDRRNRDFSITVQKAGMNPNTKDSSVVHTVNAYVKEGNDTDDNIQRLLLNYGLHKTLTEAELKEVEQHNASILRIVKECCKKTQALHAFMKA